MALQAFSGLRPAFTLPLALLLCCCASAAAAGTLVTVSTAKLAKRSDKEVRSCMVVSDGVDINIAPPPGGD
jgi:hypothetical protein